MAQIPISGTIVKISENHYTFIPDELLFPNTQYTINVTNGVHSQVSGIECRNFIASFETETLPFEVLDVDPIDNKEYVSSNKKIRIEFSNNIDLSTVDYNSIFLSWENENKLGMGTNSGPANQNPPISGKLGMGAKVLPPQNPPIEGKLGMGMKPMQNPNVNGEQFSISDRHLLDFPDNPNVDGHQVVISDRYIASESDNPNVDGEQLTITDEYI